MFIMKDEIKAFWPVKVKEPNPKSVGTFTEYKFEVEFRLINRDEAQERDDTRAEILGRDGDPREILQALNDFDDESYIGLISDWRGIFDEDKNEIPFSSEILLQALKRPHIRAAVQLAYEELATGKVHKKN